MGDSFTKSYGGKGANQAVAIARLGMTVRLCCMMGDDSFGISYKEHLRAEGCDTDNILTCSTSTGTALIAVENSGTNSIVVVPGANFALTEMDISKFQGTFEMTKIMICQNEIKFQSTILALKLGKHAGCTTIFNPSPVTDDCITAIPFADILCPNEVELEMLTGCSVQTDAKIREAVDILRHMGGRIIVVTLGERGACVSDAEGEITFISAPVVHVVDTVGAGDCFLGALASFLCKGNTLVEAVKNAIRCASISVTSRGAQSSYPHFADIAAITSGVSV